MSCRWDLLLFSCSKHQIYQLHTQTITIAHGSFDQSTCTSSVYARVCLCELVFFSFGNALFLVHLENAHSWCHHHHYHRHHCGRCWPLFSNEGAFCSLAEGVRQTERERRSANKGRCGRVAHVPHRHRSLLYCERQIDPEIILCPHIQSRTAQKSYFGCDLLHFVPYIYTFYRHIITFPFD